MENEKQSGSTGLEDKISTARPALSKDARFFLALAVALVVSAAAFLSGYLTLRGPDGWVGSRMYALSAQSMYASVLDHYREEHGEYPETLPPDFLYSGERQKRIVYERTDDGWRITDYGLDEKPGGVGLDADVVYTSGMGDHELRRVLSDKKFNATFKQVLAKSDGKWFYGLLRTTLFLGVVVFFVAFGILGGLKKTRPAWSLFSMLVIAVAAIVVGGFLTMLHSVASGH